MRWSGHASGPLLIQNGVRGFGRSLIGTHSLHNGNLLPRLYSKTPRTLFKGLLKNRT